MAEFIQGLTSAESGVTAANIWATILPMAGFIAVLILVKLGYNQLRRTSSNATRPNSKKVM